MMAEETKGPIKLEVLLIVLKMAKNTNSFPLGQTSLIIVDEYT
jgi:hypothetical protein